MTTLPSAAERPLMTIDELVGCVPALGRTATYEACRRGDLPTIRYGRKVFVVTARLRQQWGLDGPSDVSEAGPATGPATATTEPVVEDQHGKHPRIRAV